ncbi:hypothetical protein BJX99DRAFT_221406 [Aspergillus californicus]
MSFKPEGSGTYKRHILVVDNNIVNLRLASLILQRRLNCTTSGFSNGSGALTYLADQRNPRPHLIFIKTYFLGSTPDGHEVARIIRTQPPFIQDQILQSTAIIGMITGMEPIQNSTYINDLLRKPLKVGDLQWALRTWARRDRLVPRANI